MNRNAYTPHCSRPGFYCARTAAGTGAHYISVSARHLDFPDYYGENWDAMWDCLTDVFFAAGAKAHCGGRALTPCRRELQGVRRSDAGDFQRPSGEISLGLGHIPLIGDSKSYGSQREGRPVSFLLLCPDSVRRPSTAHVFSPDIVLFHLIGEGSAFADLQLRRRFGETAAVAAVGVLIEEDLVPEPASRGGAGPGHFPCMVSTASREMGWGISFAGEDGGGDCWADSMTFSAPGRCRASYKPERYLYPLAVCHDLLVEFLL